MRQRQNHSESRAGGRQAQRVRPRADAFPLTEAQKEIWLAAQMGGDAALGYNESLKLDFRGAFDLELFRRGAAADCGAPPDSAGNFSADGQSQQINRSPGYRCSAAGPQRESWKRR